MLCGVQDCLCDTLYSLSHTLYILQIGLSHTLYSLQAGSCHYAGVCHILCSLQIDFV